MHQSDTKVIVPRQSDRFPLELSIELYACHRWHRLAMQDVSRTGMFAAMPTPLPLGTPVVVGLVHTGVRLAWPGRVAHSLGGDDARALSRASGVGIAFRESPDPEFADAIEALLRRARTRQPQHSHIVVAASESRLLERLSTALGDAGFSVATASTGLEVLGAASRQIPDLVLADRTTPIIDGLRLIEQLAYDDRLASVPVIVMANDPGDVEAAFHRGAADAILKPFTMLEVIARTRRVAMMPRRAERMSLAGSLDDIDLGTVLMMLEQQRKTGRIVMSNGHAAWVDIVDGRIVDAGWSLGRSPPRAIVMELLEWKQGTFKLTASPVRRRDVDLAIPITHVLLEQARLRDEASRPVRRPS